MEDFGSLFSVSVLERYDSVRSQRQQAQASVDLPNRGLDSPLYSEKFVDQVKNWNEIVQILSDNSMCTPQPQFIIIAI